MLPQDPVILLSVVNARLRDLYPDLDELCHSEDASCATAKTPTGPSWRRSWPPSTTTITRSAISSYKDIGRASALPIQLVKKALLQGVPPSADGGIK